MKLSIVILNFNTKELTLKCVDSILKNTTGVDYEILVVDNGSDEKIPKSKKYRLIESKENLGFAGGNNLARKFVKGEYVLFLNSDTEVYKNTLKETVNYLNKNKDVGGVTVKMILPNGKLDRDARRSFPTPWVSITHFSGLDKLFPKSKLFARYWYGYKSTDEIAEVDVFQGAFFMTRKVILEKVGWFSEDYFLDGEDLDLSWKIKNEGWKLIYYPNVSILHIKKASKKKRSLKSKMAGVNSMEIFYIKHQWENYPLILNLVVIIAIYFMKMTRFIKAIIPSK
ncbi:glycosyltransferase family 2 protein [soil metagenome]